MHFPEALSLSVLFSVEVSPRIEVDARKGCSHPG